MGKHVVVTCERSIGDVDPAADRLLVERAQAGDRDAFGELFAWYRDRLVRYCRQHLLDLDDAEDATQESFVRAWRALASLSGDRHFYPWLRVIAHNVCMDWNRRRRSEPFERERISRLATPVVAEDEETLATLDGQLALEALRHLSPRHREVLELREQLSWTYQRIADHEGVAISTIETLLFRARRALRKEFMALAGGDGAAVLLFLRVRRGLGRLIGLYASNPADTADAPVIAVRLGTVGAVVAAATIASVVAIGPHYHRGPHALDYPRAPDALQGRAHAFTTIGGVSGESTAGPGAPGRGLGQPRPTTSTAAAAMGGPPSSNGSSPGTASSPAGAGRASDTTSDAATGAVTAPAVIGSSARSENVLPATGQASSGPTTGLANAVTDVATSATTASQQLAAAVGSALQAAAAAVDNALQTVTAAAGSTLQAPTAVAASAVQAVTAVAVGATPGSPAGAGGTPPATPAPNASSATGTATVTSTVAAAAPTVANSVVGAGSTVAGATADAGNAAGSAASTVDGAVTTTVTTLAQTVAGLLGH